MFRRNDTDHFTPQSEERDRELNARLITARSAKLVAVFAGLVAALAPFHAN